MQKRTRDHLRQNIALARKWIGKLRRQNYLALSTLSLDYGFSIALGDLLLLDEKWYVTHTGEFCDASTSRWVFKATVYKSPRSRGFVGYGDADPSNVSSLVHGAEMRVAETRAVNRALRKAYGIGLCSVEELGWAPRSSAPVSSGQHRAPSNGNNGHENGRPRLRDRLCLLIRQHHLDAALVKAYAADYCGTPTLRDAGRDQVEAFINDLAERADKNRDALVCALNAYRKQPEVNS